MDTKVLLVWSTSCNRKMKDVIEKGIGHDGRCVYVLEEEHFPMCFSLE